MNDAVAQANRRSTDTEHLNLLSTFHYVAAGLSFIGILAIVGHYWLFTRLMAGDLSPMQRPGAPQMPVDLFAMFKWMYIIIAVFLVATAAVNLLSGLFMRSRQHRTFSIVVAVLNCLHMPLGTALGVFTIVVLVRDSVRELYGD